MTEIDENVAKIWLQKKIDEFIDRFDPIAPRDEFWMNDFENVKDILNRFCWFINHDDDDEKAKRRQLYEELKKEFGE